MPAFHRGGSAFFCRFSLRGGGLARVAPGASAPLRSGGSAPRPGGRGVCGRRLGGSCSAPLLGGRRLGGDNFKEQAAELSAAWFTAPAVLLRLSPCKLVKQIKHSSFKAVMIQQALHLENVACAAIHSTSI